MALWKRSVRERKTRGRVTDANDLVAYRLWLLKRLRCLIVVLALALMGAAFVAPRASAASETLVGFGELYGANHQHLGIDVAAHQGDDVLAPVEGVISFLGAIPKTPGQRVKALTIQTADGRLVSLSPLEDISVARGASVSKGDRLGVVALDGDPSNAATHLHMSLRVARRYVDPSGLLEAALPSSRASQEGEARSTSASALAAVDRAAQTVPRMQTQRAPQNARVTPETESVAAPESHAGYAHAPSLLGSARKASRGEALETAQKVHDSQGVHARASSGAALTLMELKRWRLKEGYGEFQRSRAASLNGNTDITTTADGEPIARVMTTRRSAWAALETEERAAIIFGIGLILTLAGLGGKSLIHQQFDRAGKVERLAVRSPR